MLEGERRLFASGGEKVGETECWDEMMPEPSPPSTEHQRSGLESEEEAQNPCQIKINILNKNKVNFCSLEQIWGVWGREKGEERV